MSKPKSGQREKLAGVKRLQMRDRNIRLIEVRKTMEGERGSWGLLKEKHTRLLYF
jgi:hypothetical protein